MLPTQTIQRLAADEMVEIIVEYKITNNGNETTNHFRLQVLPEVADDGTTVTARTAIYAKEVDTIAGLTINENGSFTFDPTNTAYNTLSAGDFQEIDITYEAKDFDGLTDENHFSITVSGTNDAPTANFDTKQYATENASEAGFTTTDGGDTYTVNLTGRFAADADSDLCIQVSRIVLL